MTGCLKTPDCVPALGRILESPACHDWGVFEHGQMHDIWIGQTVDSVLSTLAVALVAQLPNSFWGSLIIEGVNRQIAFTSIGNYGNAE